MSVARTDGRDRSGAAAAGGVAAAAAGVAAAAGAAAMHALDAAAPRLSDMEITRQWVESSHAQHQLTPVGAKIADAMTSGQLNDAIALIGEYETETLEARMLDCYALLQRSASAEFTSVFRRRLVFRYFQLGSDPQFVANKLSTEAATTLQALATTLPAQSPETQMIIAQYFRPPVEQLCLSIVRLIPDERVLQSQVLDKFLDSVGPNPSFWEESRKIVESFPYQLKQPALSQLLKHAPLEIVRRWTTMLANTEKENGTPEVFLAEHHMAIVSRSKMEADFRQAFEYVQSLKNYVFTNPLFGLLLLHAEGAMHDEIANYALQRAMERQRPCEVQASELARLLEDGKNLLPQITSELRRVLLTLKKDNLFIRYQDLLESGDSMQRDGIAQEAFAYVKRLRATNKKLLAALLDATTGQTRQQVIEYVCAGIVQVNDLDPELIAKCAENPPEHLRQEILSHLLKLESVQKKMSNIIILLTAYCKLADVAQFREQLDHSLDVAREARTYPHMDAKLGKLYAALLKKIDADRGVALFEEAFAFAKRMTNPVAGAELITILLECSRPLRADHLHETIIEYALSLLDHKTTTPDAKTLLYQAILDHARVAPQMEKAIFAHILRNKPERNLKAAMLLKTLVEKVSSDNVSEIILYAAGNTKFMQNCPERGALLEAILARASSDRTLIAQRTRILNRLFTNPSLELFDTLLKPVIGRCRALLPEGEERAAFERQVAQTTRDLGQRLTSQKDAAGAAGSV